MKAQEADGKDRAISDDSGSEDARAMTSLLLSNAVDCPPEYIKLVDKHFWELFGNVQDAIRDCERARDLEARAMYSMLRGISS